jgi:hypothetical protein
LIEALAAPLLGRVEANGRWAPLVLPLVAFLGSFAVIGLFVPGSPVLVGAGSLVAVGVLSPLAVLAATALGRWAGVPSREWWKSRRRGLPRLQHANPGVAGPGGDHAKDGSKEPRCRPCSPGRLGSIPRRPGSRGESAG